MQLFDAAVFLIGFPLGLLLAGYWLVTPMTGNETSARPTVALLAGLATLLLAVSVVNFLFPLSGGAGWACLLPILVSLTGRKSREVFWHDMRALAGRRAAWAQAAVLAFFFALLLWPLLSDPSLMLHEGGGNHDSFFWIVDADHLKGHTYMQHPLRDALHPALGAADAVIGWLPAWGRMGAEGLLALLSSLSGRSALELYTYFSASLYLPWLAVGQLTIRTFYAEHLSRTAQVTLLLLHPVFIYFHRNSNLPNLLGVIMGAFAIIAVERSLRISWETQRKECLMWCGLTVLGLHGLYCAYSEMIPFVLLPCGLLWLRTFFPLWRRTPNQRLAVAGAIAASVLVNPVTSMRAGWGFYAALMSARADDRWADILIGLDPSRYLPALVTLSPSAAKSLAPWAGGIVSLIFLVGLALAWRHARDRTGTLFIFSGSAVLLAYTLMTDFTYGWQKSIQFCGVFLSVAVSAAAIDALTRHELRGVARGLARAGAAALAAYLIFSVGMQCREILKWSHRKAISRDWLSLLDKDAGSLRKAPVLIDAATFRSPFFHSMWAAYFLPESQLYFGTRGEESGGYLRDAVIREGQRDIPAPAAVLVGREWADTVDAGSPRLLTGREYTLLSRANRVFDLRGVLPLSGVPEVASPHIFWEIAPPTTATLSFVLAPQKDAVLPVESLSWQLRRLTDDGHEFTARIDGPPPWHVAVPLIGRQKQTVMIDANAEPLGEYPFAISDLTISRAPAPLSPVDGVVDFSPDGSWEDYEQGGLNHANATGVVAGPDDAFLEFAALPAHDDIELELVALLPPNAPAGTMLATELWFNDSLIFTGFFGGPGVLRARIFHEHWNQRPVGQFKLRFPQEPSTGLVLKTLTMRRTTTPRP